AAPVPAPARRGCHAPALRDCCACCRSVERDPLPLAYPSQFNLLTRYASCWSQSKKSASFANSLKQFPFVGNHRSGLQSQVDQDPVHHPRRNTMKKMVIAAALLGLYGTAQAAPLSVQLDAVDANGVGKEV